MTKDKLKELIIETISNYYETIDLNSKVDEKTELIGHNSLIDSMGLVTIVVDIESKLREMDIHLTIMSEKAMSLRNSPLRDVESLVEFIQSAINE